MGDIKNFIAARVAKELKDGDVVNLGSDCLRWFRTISRKVWILHCSQRMDL